MGRHADIIDKAQGADADKDADARALQALATGGRSFYWASHFLGRKTAHDAAHLYRFCRTLDDLADGDLPDGPARLSAINAQLDALAAGDKDTSLDPALSDFMPTLNACSVPIRPIQHLLDGLLFDQQDVALKTNHDLIKYAYQVAGTVGLLMCPVLGCQNRQAFSFAVDMGIAMQLTNIARDVQEDAEMGRRYLPGDWVGNLSAASISALPRQSGTSETASEIAPEIVRVTAAIDRLLLLAEGYYQSGMKGLVYLPPRAHIAIAVAANVYREIGQKLRRRQLDWTQGRTVTNGMEKAVASFGAFSSLPARIGRKKPVYQADLHSALQGYLELDSL